QWLNDQVQMYPHTNWCYGYIDVFFFQAWASTTLSLKQSTFAINPCFLSDSKGIYVLGHDLIFELLD
ncbi:hypothetical protein, partial [Aeromonas caviae]|uniref:hypothetical protein n=1 Tax=Aeromonas caviae TaxID=648 RepID=UPI002280BFDB